MKKIIMPNRSIDTIDINDIDIGCCFIGCKDGIHKTIVCYDELENCNFIMWDLCHIRKLQSRYKNLQILMHDVSEDT